MIKLDKLNISNSSLFKKQHKSDTKLTRTNPLGSENSYSSNDNSNKSLERVDVDNQDNNSNAKTLTIGKSKFRTKSLKTPKNIRNLKYFRSIAYIVFFFCCVRKITRDNNKLLRLKSLKRFVYCYDTDQIIDSIKDWMYGCIKITYMSLLKNNTYSFDISVEGDKDAYNKELLDISEDHNFKYIKLEV